MPLSPPPDNSKAIFAAAVGLSLVLLVLVYSRNTLPQVGDNIHSLPHGGVYRDGTKSVFYGAPGKLNSLEKAQKILSQPWAWVIALVAVIILLSSGGGRRNCACGRNH